MLRVQIARDRSMAASVADALVAARPGQRVLLLAGAQHVSRDRGIPLHLPAELTRHVVMFGAAEASGLQADQWRDAVQTPRPDPCEDLRRRGLRPRRTP